MGWLLPSLALFLHLTVCTQAGGGPAYADNASWSTQTGAQLAQSFQPVVSADEKTPREGKSNCVQLISNQLEVELQSAVEGGFLMGTQLLAQISNVNKMEKVCGTWDGKKDELEECHRSDSMGLAESQRDTSLLVLLKLVCVKYTKVVERNSECINDMESTTQWKCVDACHRQTMGTPSPKFGQSMSAMIPVKLDDEMVCKIGTCVIRCVGAQVAECAEENNNTNAAGNTDELRSFYSDLSGAQMLRGVEMAQAAAGGQPTYYSLLKSKKMPLKCQQIMSKAVENSSTSSNDVRGEDGEDLKENVE